MPELEIRGLQELIKGLKDNANLDDVKKVVRLNGARFQRLAMKNAPKDTHTLERSIKLTLLDNGFTAKITTNTDYAGYVEFGTRYMYPRRYMWRTYVFQKRVFESDMRRLVKK